MSHPDVESPITIQEKSLDPPTTCSSPVRLSATHFWSQETDDEHIWEYSGNDASCPPGHAFEIGDWVMPQDGPYQADAGCMISRCMWGYNVAFLPCLQLPTSSHPHYQSSLAGTSMDTELRPLSLGIGANNIKIQEGFLIMGLEQGHMSFADTVASDHLEKFLRHTHHPNSASDTTPIQDIVDQSFCRSPIPQEWHFKEGERVQIVNQMRTGVVAGVYRNVVEVTLEDGSTSQLAWPVIMKAFNLGDYVEVVGGEYAGCLGYVQDIVDTVGIEVLEITVHRNCAKVFTISRPEHTPIETNEDLSPLMCTDTVPWKGIHILILRTDSEMRDSYLDDTNRTTSDRHGPYVQADSYKGKVSTVVDMSINQAGISGLKVCVRLDQNYSVTHAWPEIWLDYHQVVEEKSTTPPFSGPSEDYGTGNAWDVTAPNVPPHWSEHLALAERELRVNIPKKSQPQKIKLGVSSEPTVRDYHRWVVIMGAHIGKCVHGIRYVQGSKPIQWTVREIIMAEDDHDSFVGEAFDVRNSELCQMTDSQRTLDLNHQWAQTVCDEPVRIKKRKIQDT
ncbi:hypothetical protein EDD18DRAFT_1108698 [Armillaria luteobubalina]|uniref:Uncharacterized protein n=1 Tax=Armillaria luteobubalina TaxID=153913 RepID=A0AA39PY17_9AGAR|nr:hypothetical protein EDD18DRAFT_1108698 [Armillaria luteobubalina]